MKKIVFLVEERSMKVLLGEMLPRLYPNLNFLCVEHEGKQDLDKSVPRKLAAWREPNVGFVVVRDQDRSDCREIKAALAESCRRAGRPDTLVRIACHELEAWYFGAPDALAKAFDAPQLRDTARKAKFRDPDAIVNPSRELEKVVPSFQKVSGARTMGRHLERTGNRSRSFQFLIEGLDRLVAKIDSPPKA
jgi:hypothetical protein